MKVAFAGAHSTGKTILLNNLCEALREKNIPFACINEIARKIINRGYPLNQDATIESYICYINTQLSEENEKMNTEKLFFSDRTLLDPVAYETVNARLFKRDIPYGFVDMMKRIWLLEKDRYDLYVYFPIEFELEMDGIRPKDANYRIAVDKEIIALLNENNINYIKVSGSVDERKEYLLSYLLNQTGKK